MTLTTYDGGEAQVSDGSPGTNSIFVGLSVSFLPKVAGDSFNLLAGATSTESDSSRNGTTGAVTTNLIAACRVLLSNGGGVVLDDGTTTRSHLTNYWIIISTMAVDAQGRPKKLEGESHK